MSNTCVVILAAGKGSRMKAQINKQFLKLKEKPILYYTLKSFCQNKYIDNIVLVVAKGEKNYCRENVINKYNISKIKAVVEGGNTRQESVLNGLRAANGCDIVLIHDGARPFVENNIIENGIKYAEAYGASACGVNSKDTIKLRDSSGFSTGTLDRNVLFCVQTPQCFKYDVILKCHERAVLEDIEATDDTMIAEKFNHKVYLYNGSYNNIKITTPEDLIIGEKILDSM
ncbi:2-C-methyl-D-erythritol 4-phosphate cytidylyltransferase [Clostridium sp. MB40-C1]|uniref:2-C-methyl-D-erythritol 4-phosphate cytidylyltransferase n=1 Tax=Clostridium sp. MB40-C1 TaxID=3070996 RepID=UPI0027DEE9E5|nr:2-C-methyl-D-erythritol 4-phosphate cytidylyltransferase [Clostridium sp. MB40-C1]WMJ80316.1 2-C-methyl-D-erythritol 4-phosphate cytidylyltransferase [Clostridium sp. MB40-C1]